MGLVDDEQEAARADLTRAAAKISEGQAELRKAVNRAAAAKLTQTEIAALGSLSRPTVRSWLAEDTEYRQFETAFGWDKDVPLTEAEQEDLG